MPTFDVVLNVWDHPDAYNQKRERINAGEIIEYRVPDIAPKYGAVILLTNKCRIIRVNNIEESILQMWAARDTLLPEDLGKGFAPRKRRWRAQVKNIPQIQTRKYPRITDPVFSAYPEFVALMGTHKPDLSTLKTNETRTTIYDYEVDYSVIAPYFFDKGDEPRDLSGFPEDDLIESHDIATSVDDGIR